MPYPADRVARALRTQDALMLLLGDLADAIRAELADAPLCAVVLSPNAAVRADFCTCGTGTESCGQGWVRYQRIYPSAAFPLPDSVATCETRLAVVVEVGTLRCQAGMTSEGSAPTVAAQTNDTIRLMEDAAALRRAIADAAATSDVQYVLGAWVPVDSGDCGGGMWTVTMTIPTRS